MAVRAEMQYSVCKRNDVTAFVGKLKKKNQNNTELDFWENSPKKL